jgi:FtsP/CotA-like multicopper oxidase with cupredoxin domain
VTTNQLMLLDLVVSIVAAGSWLGVGSAGDRRTLSRVLLYIAAAFTAARVVTVVLLAESGWWFVQEKVTLTLPLLLVGATVALIRRQPVWYFTAGYAALAGPLVTLLHGYPSTWAVALITVALVGGASALTASMLGVRRLRAAAVASGTALLVGVVLALVAAPEPSPMDGVSVAAMRGPSTGDVVRRYTLDARQATITLASGATLRAWTFNGQVPGPPITAEVGDLVEVTLHNTDIADGVTLHWHGYDVPAGEDGVPGLTQDAVAPGQSFVYRFRADRPGSYWYHTHEASSQGVRMGLYGTLVVTARPASAGVDLTLPVHTFNGSTVVSDPDDPVGRVVAAGTPVRLRLVNTDSTPRVLGLVGSPVRVAAVDGTELNDPAPVDGAGLRIAAGGRYDVTFTMPDHAVALRIAHADSEVTLAPTPGLPGPAGDVGGWPVLDLLRYGSPAATPFGDGSHFDRDFTLVLDRGLALVGGTPSYAYTVNGAAYPHIAAGVVREGDLVRFTIVNRSQDIHPWHLHGHRVLVLSRDGVAPTGSPLWMDTFDVRPGEVWRVAFRADNPGIWMNHCHNLAHADQGMALHLAYEGVTSPFHGGHGG